MACRTDEATDNTSLVLIGLGADFLLVNLSVVQFSQPHSDRSLCDTAVPNSLRVKDFGRHSILGHDFFSHLLFTSHELSSVHKS